MWKKLIFLPIWFISSFAIVGGCILTIRFIKNGGSQEVSAYQDLSSPIIPNFPSGQVKGVQTTLEAEDARVEIVYRFLERHNAALEPKEHFAQVFVETADRYGIDYRLLPAIAMQESNLCKKIPEGSHNCLGFGIHARGTLGFESFEANFDRAARELKKNYIDIGLTTPEKIMRKYTPSSNGSWANSVNQWITEMEYDSREKGRAIDQDANLQEYVSQ